MQGAITTIADSGSGHRSRLRQRLFDGGPKALLDHELVEYLLALAIPRRDTKAQAKKLIAEFGGLGPLLSADAETLSRAGLSDNVVAALKSPKRPPCASWRRASRGGRCCRTGRRSAIIFRRRWPIPRSRKSACCSSTPRIC